MEPSLPATELSMNDTVPPAEASIRPGWCDSSLVIVE
jgi:hypothetical protein